MKKIVLSGPMTGLKNYNFEAFDNAAVDLARQGFRVFNPADLGRTALKNFHEVEVGSLAYKELMEECKRHIETCDILVLLNGWENSNGAKAEVEYALSLGKSIEVYKPLLCADKPCKQLEFGFMEAESSVNVVEAIDALCRSCNTNAARRGWWEEERSFGEIIALIHSELSEALEYARKDMLAKSDHIDGFTGIEEEFADVLIRIFDYCGQKHLRLGEAVVAKMDFNKTRPYKHGKKF